MANILIVYSTTDGHTLHICERLKRVVEEQDHTVTIARADEPSVNLKPYDKVVIGASIRYGKHSVAVHDFINAHQRQIENRPNAFFSVNVVARKPEKNTPETNPYLQKFLTKIAWRPRQLAVFAGKIDYPKYRFWDRQAIRFIMWMTKGPTDPTAVVEFTNWDSVDEFGRLIATM